MADITQSKKVLKGSAVLYLRTPLLLKSGYGDMFSDSTVEKTYNGDYIHINGYVWANLMRRCINRLKNGEGFAWKIGKYKSDENDDKSASGVSPLWCEASFVPAEAMYVRPGNAIDRRYGAVKEGALYNDEIAPAGMSMNLNWNYFLGDGERIEDIEKLFSDALWVLNAGIENIGGGWSYGMGRLGVRWARIKTIHLDNEYERASLWRFDDEAFKDASTVSIDTMQKPEIAKSWICISARASILRGQLLSIHSGYPAFDAAESFPEYPDSFVYKGYRIDGKEIITKAVIPGRSIRQALFSTSIERKLRTMGSENGRVICDSLAGVCTCDDCVRYRGNSRKGDDSPNCKCVKCNWFGSGGKGGIISVMDSFVEDADSEIIHRINLCEHSMQNINLFSGEYLTKGKFNIQIIIDKSHNPDDAEELAKEVEWVLNDMKADGASPPGWYRIGATSTSTGQVAVSGDLVKEVCGGING